MALDEHDAWELEPVSGYTCERDHNGGPQIVMNEAARSTKTYACMFATFMGCKVSAPDTINSIVYSSSQFP